MDKVKFLARVERDLCAIFKASKDGYAVSAVERHRLEGFIHAGVFMQLTTNEEIKRLMEKAHIAVFNQTQAQRRKKAGVSWQNEAIDYSQYDQPTYER